MSVEPLGGTTRTSTASASAAIWRTNARAGRAGSSRHGALGEASVPQWIGTATRGSRSAAARAARAGSK
jgi:hypothetical protein